MNIFFLERPATRAYNTCPARIGWFCSWWSPWSLHTWGQAPPCLAQWKPGPLRTLPSTCLRCASCLRTCRGWISPFLMCYSSVWNCAFFLLSPFRRDGFSSGMPNTNPRFNSRALFPSTPPRAGYLQTCHPTMWVNPPVKWKEGKAPSQRIWADEPYITRAKNMQLIGMEKRKMTVLKP